LSERRAAARYGEALFDLAQERGAVGELREELEELVGLVEAAPGLRALLERPDLEVERKLEALRAGLGGRFSETVAGLLGTLVRHGRGGIVGEVVETYGELADDAAGVVRAEVRTVVALAKGERERLVAALERLTGRRVRLGDKLIDGSAAGRLARMREELMDQQGRRR